MQHSERWSFSCLIMSYMEHFSAGLSKSLGMPQGLQALQVWPVSRWPTYLETQHSFAQQAAMPGSSKSELRRPQPQLCWQSCPLPRQDPHSWWNNHLNRWQCPLHICSKLRWILESEVRLGLHGVHALPLPRQRARPLPAPSVRYCAGPLASGSDRKSKQVAELHGWQNYWQNKLLLASSSLPKLGACLMVVIWRKTDMRQLKDDLDSY